MEEHIDDLATVVRDRQPSERVVAAARRYVLDRLAARDPVSGLTDNPVIRALVSIAMTTPTLHARLAAFPRRCEAALVAELKGTLDELTATVVAAQIIAARQVLTEAVLRDISADRPADDIYPEAVARTNRVFDLLEHGIPY